MIRVGFMGNEFSVRGSLAANEANYLRRVLRVRGIVPKAKFPKKSIISQRS